MGPAGCVWWRTSGGGISTSCSTPPKDGMEIKTNTPKLQKHRKMIIELLLANHDRDCTTCEKNGRCKLQELAIRFGIKNVRFGERKEVLPIDNSSTSIIRNPNKCILCGDCVRVCEEVQGVGVLGFAHRGSKIQVMPAFGKALKDVDCVNCGQCRVVCPTGALIIRNETDKVWNALHNNKKRVVAQIAPAVRVAIGEEFGMAPGEVTIGKIVAALKKLGFDEVYDTSLAADLTVMEESKEFAGRLKNGEKLPLFTSCCPAWVKYAKQKYPELDDNISSCKSPQQMFGTVIKEYYRNVAEKDGRETVLVSVMPCTAKKYEAQIPEFETEGTRDVDVVLTTQELCIMLKQAGIVFNELEPEALDMPFGLASGAGVIFGVTGGVTEAVLRRVVEDKSSNSLKNITFVGIRGMEGIKEATIVLGEKELKIAVVNGLKNAERLVEMIKSGEKQYDFIEVMACTGGCIGGAGQPLPGSQTVRKLRAKGIYSADKVSQIKRSEENPTVASVYDTVLKGKEHILHVKKHCECGK